MERLLPLHGQMRGRSREDMEARFIEVSYVEVGYVEVGYVEVGYVLLYNSVYVLYGCVMWMCTVYPR